MATTDELLDALMKDYKKPEDLIGENGLLKQLTKRLLERAMQAELTDHLGYEKHAPAGNNSGNSRNGNYKKRVKGEFGNLDVAVPRDHNASFEPVILPKGESRFTGFDDKIISMYARGMTTRDIQGHLEEIYGVQVSPTLVSQVTEAVTDEIRLWQNRPLDEVYPILYLDAVRVKVRHDGHVINKAVYLAIAITMDGLKNRVQFAFSGIDTQLKKRFDLIPNLIATVERYMQHEQQVLQQLTSLRSQAVRGTATTDELVQMDNQLTSTLRSVFALSENYPQLRASENFIQLQGP